MVFIIKNKKYDTEKMRKVAVVSKRFPIKSVILQNMFGENIEQEKSCDLYLSNKGQWMIVYENNSCSISAQLIDPKEAKSLLMKSDYKKYEEMFGEIEEG